MELDSWAHLGCVSSMCKSKRSGPIVGIHQSSKRILAPGWQWEFSNLVSNCEISNLIISSFITIQAQVQKKIGGYNKESSSSLKAHVYLLLNLGVYTLIQVNLIVSYIFVMSVLEYQSYYIRTTQI